ncbi:MAG: hypothetical protein RBT71_00850 [Flavobacteriales bacterium]|nr:hypothetical protein [Flavobacteriales bacterium]
MRRPIALVCTFLWVGFVCAISFMEAWLKFRAAGVTVPVGLGIGQLVFGALNKVELVLAAAIAIDLVLGRDRRRRLLLAAVPATILLVQTLHVLPALDVRAVLVIAGQDPGPSNLHLLFVAMEVVKVAALVMFGIGLFEPAARTVEGPAAAQGPSLDGHGPARPDHQPRPAAPHHSGRWDTMHPKNLRS